ncbi:MAG TPA: hypothetical protein VFU71_16625 [Burkholderiaceae bacterium]|nr:hypothetical protein [Burkholderiaceae bacterium]
MTLRSSHVSAARSIASIALLLGATMAWPGDQRADPASDAPEQQSAIRGVAPAPASYTVALQTWQRAEDLSSWLGEHFEYDTARALRLSETQRARSGRLPIHEPAAFFAVPRGVCVDVARFAVESLRAIDPQARAGYLMIEFDPATLSGQTLRRHWVATFERDGRLYVFGDSKRPGHLAGPYADAAAFVADYARYRGREVVAYRQLATYERQRRQLATRQPREAAQP